MLVEEVFAAEGADGADIDDVSGEWIIDGVSGEDVDFFVGAAADDLEFCGAADFAGEANAAGAHDAAVGEESNLVADVFFIRLDVFGFVESAVAATVIEGVVLEVAFACLIAGGAVKGVIEQEVFECCLAGFLDFGAVGDDDGAIFGWGLATGYEFRLHGDGAVGLFIADFDEAHAAAGDDGEFRVPAVGGDFDAGFGGCLNTIQPLVGTDFNFFAIDKNCGHAESWGKWACRVLVGSHEFLSGGDGGFSGADVVFEFRAEFVDGIFDGPCSAIGETADGGSGDDAHGPGNFEEEVEVFGAAVAGADAFENFGHPVGAFAAGSALAAGLVGHKPAAIIEDVDHAGVVIDDDNSGGSESEAADFTWTGKVEFGVEFFIGEEAHADTAGNDGFGFAAFPDATGMFFDEFSSGDTEGKFDAAGAVDMAAHTIKLGPIAAWVAGIIWIRGDADGFEPFGAAIEDVSYAAKRFNIINDGGFAKETFDGGEGRLDSGPGALAFEAFDESGFFSADVGASAAVEDDIEVDAGAENVFTEDSGGFAFANGSIECAVAGAVFVAEVEVGFIGADGVAGENDAFDELMGIFFHQVAVIEGSGFAFVGVDGEVDGAGVVFG